MRITKVSYRNLTVNGFGCQMFWGLFSIRNLSRFRLEIKPHPFPFPIKRHTARMLSCDKHSEEYCQCDYQSDARFAHLWLAAWQSLPHRQYTHVHDCFLLFLSECQMGSSWNMSKKSEYIEVENMLQRFFRRYRTF